MADSCKDPTLVQLHRFLYLGDVAKQYPNSVTYPFTNENVQSVLEAAGTGNDVIREIVRIYRDGHYLGSDTVIYALAVFAHSKNNLIKQQAFEAAVEICSSSAAMLTFNHIYKELSKPATGWGRAHRRFIINWYNGKEAKDLAVEVTKVKSRHKWTHKDVLCMAHVKAQHAGNSAVLKYAVRGMEVAAKDCESQSEAEHVLNYLKGVYELAHTTDPQAAARLIEIHDLCLEHVPSKMLKTKEVCLCLIPRVPLKSLLELLPRFSKLGLLKPNSPSYKSLLERLASEETLLDVSLDPLETFVVIRRWQMANRILPGKTIIRQNTPALDDALQNLHLASFKTVTSAEKRYLIALDTRLTMNHSHCAGCSVLTPSHVSDIVLMALIKAEMSNVTVVVFSSEELVPVDINNKMTLSDVVEHLSNVPAGPVQLSAPIQWALQKKKSYDTFVVFTDHLSSTEDHDSVAALKEYKEIMHLPNARYFISSLCDRESTFSQDEPDMLNIVGFNVKLLKIIQDFASGVF